jgi:HK97 family phage major capsid protein
MNINDIETRQREHALKGAELYNRAGTAKRDGTLKSVDADIKKWLAESDRLKADRNKAVVAAMKGVGSDSFADNKAVGRQPSVLDIPEREYKSLFDAVQKRQPSYRIDTKAPFGEGSFTSGGLPPVLMPQLTQQLPYEPDDVFDHLIQMAAPQASSVEWLSHTGNTNPAAATAELAQKPDLGPILTTHTMPFTKIAALASFSTESLSDFSYFTQFVPGEMFRAARDARTNEVLNGSGSSPHMLGLLNQPNVLTRVIGSDSPIDCLRKSFNDLRVGSAFANASLVILNPTTWADIQLQKATGGLYLLNPTDPNSIGSLNDIFGVKVVTNTYCPAGTAVVLDTSKAVLAWTRQSWSLEINQYGTNEFNENYVTFRVEGRFAIGAMYPTAINLVTGLPSS